MNQPSTANPRDLKNFPASASEPETAQKEENADAERGSRGREAGQISRVCGSDNWPQSLRAARERRLTKDQRSLWSVTFDALAKYPGLREQFASGIRQDLGR